MHYINNEPERQKRIYKAVDSYNHRLQRAIGTYGKHSAIVKGMMEQANFSKHITLSNRDSGNIATGKHAIYELSDLRTEFVERTLERITPGNILVWLERRMGIYNKTFPNSIKEIKERLAKLEDKADVIIKFHKDISKINALVNEETDEDYLPTDIETWAE